MDELAVSVRVRGATAKILEELVENGYLDTNIFVHGLSPR